MNKIKLRELTASDLGRWVRIADQVGQLHTFAHTMTGVTTLGLRGGKLSHGLALTRDRVDIEHWASESQIELLTVCESCESLILDEEPVHGGEDGDIALHPKCADDATGDQA